MEYLSTIALTALFTVALLFAYKYLVNPSVVGTLALSAVCPDGWSYKGKMCHPDMKTSCMPFDPHAPTLSSTTAKCNLARTCGTDWNGACP
uniref:CPW-WPC domain-containing protein n=1 Tax=viral metagenome TaxID=1070528 RepID=A0A6C0K172_9ZZZZ